MKKFLTFFLTLLLSFLTLNLSSCIDSNDLYILNWDEYINEDNYLKPLFMLMKLLIKLVKVKNPAKTLKENDLEVIEEILPISARLIANKASFKFKTAEIEKLLIGMRAEVKKDD